MKIDKRLAVLTGGAGAVGGATAKALAVKGADLALIDRDVKGLEAVAAEARLFGAKVSTHVADLAARDVTDTLPEAIMAVHEVAPSILIHNAGIALVGRFDQISEADFDALMRINFQAAVWLTRALLPVLLRQDKARIVFLSSAFGLVAPAGQTAYSASKFAIRGFAEALGHELAETRVGVTTVHPGGIRADMARAATEPPRIDPVLAAEGGAEFESVLITSPEEAARSIVSAIEHDRPRQMIGRDAVVMDVLQRILPVHYWSVVASRLGRAVDILKTPI